MTQIILVALAAGTTAALLYASVVSGALIAILLANLAPLPILIAAIGWGHLAGLLGALTAAIALGLSLGVNSCLGFLLAVGLPAWWLGYLALLGRPTATNGSGGGIEWYPIGRLILWAAIIGTLATAGTVLSYGADKEAFQQELRTLFERALRSVQQQMKAPGETESRRFVELLVQVFPLVAAILATIHSTFNLWLAARIVDVSGRLRRPWPDLSAMALPPATPGLLAAAIAGSFLLPDLAGIFARILTASLLVAYAMMGFAVLHAITRGMGGRTAVLTLTYAIVFLITWPMLAMSMLGLAEAAFKIRARFASPGASPPTPRT
jgi:Predicted membrane protein (DUF2232)